MDATDLKYYQDIALIHNCPPPGVECRDCEAFRFVFEHPEDVRNFSPPAKIAPSRVFESDRRACDAYALSFFVSLETALAFYKKKVATYKAFRKTIGTYVAGGALASSDGLCSQPDRSGHFNFFEAEGPELKERFRIVEALT